MPLSEEQIEEIHRLHERLGPVKVEAEKERADDGLLRLVGWSAKLIVDLYHEMEDLKRRVERLEGGV
ncbi:MAG: hypothetical protein ACE5OO_01140 [Candidatus Bathyarchaeia archaeon]